MVLHVFWWTWSDIVDHPIQNLFQAEYKPHPIENPFQAEYKPFSSICRVLTMPLNWSKILKTAFEKNLKQA